MKTSILLIACTVGIVGCSQKDQVAETSAPSSTNSTAVTAATTSDSTAMTASTATTTNLTATPATQPDNTAVNTRDRAADAVTAGASGQGRSDVDITADIRKRVMGGHMSVDAQNVKIVVQNGKVTLRGPVDNQDEKNSIGQAANDVAGAENVDNELEIKTNG